MPKIVIILEGKGGELDRVYLPPVDDDLDVIDQAISSALQQQASMWVLSIGDTIRIEECE